MSALQQVRPVANVAIAMYLREKVNRLQLLNTENLRFNLKLPRWSFIVQSAGKNCADMKMFQSFIYRITGNHVFLSINIQRFPVIEKKMHESFTALQTERISYTLDISGSGCCLLVACSHMLVCGRKWLSTNICVNDFVLWGRLESAHMFGK